MKLEKFKLYKICYIILTIIFIILFIISFKYEIINQFIDKILGIGIIAYIQKKYKELKENYNSIIYRKNISPNYVNNVIEIKKIKDFLKNKNSRILLITGGTGYGKSYLATYIMYKLNNRKILSKFPNYNAIYISVHSDKNILENIKNKLNLNVDDIHLLFDELNKITNKPIVFILDDVSFNIKNFELIQFAYDILQYKAKLIVIYNNNNNNIENSQDVEQVNLRVFSKNEVVLLAKKYNKTVNYEEINSILNSSKGIPRMIDTIIKRGNFELTEQDIKNNIMIIVQNKLNIRHKQILFCIYIYNKIFQENIEISMLSNIFLYGENDKLINDCINTLKGYDLISIIEKTLRFEVSENISNEIFNDNFMDDKDINDILEKIYSYFKKQPNNERNIEKILLTTNINLDDEKENYIKRLFSKPFLEKDSNYLLYLGDLDIKDKFNLHLRRDNQEYREFQFNYLNSILHLGHYPKAKEVLKYYYSNEYSIDIKKYIYSPDENELKKLFIIVNLEHLINNFEITVTEITKCLNNNNNLNNYIELKMEFMYLNAHCLKHIGEDLNYCEKLFNNLLDIPELKNNKKLFIKVRYGILSIYLFKNIDTNYDEQFNELLSLANKNNITSIIPSITRHYIMYKIRYLNDFNTSEKMLNDLLEMLNKENNRIIYDIYFLKAEFYRLSYYKTKKNSLKDKSILYYNKSLMFANDVNDINLKTCCEMAKILFKFEENYDSEKLLNELTKIESQCIDPTIGKNDFSYEIEVLTPNSLHINYAYTQVLKCIINDDKCEDIDLKIEYYEKKGYIYIASILEKYKNDKSLDFMFTVM